MRHHWPYIIVIWSIGVLAAAQLGKMAALVPFIRAESGLSLSAGAWLISLIEVGGATLGVVAGIAIARLGYRRMLQTGTALLVLAGIVEGLAPDMAILFGGRILEAAAYLVIVIAGPSLIAFLAPPEDHGAALSLWSTFVPVGLAVGTYLSGSAAVHLSWQATCLLWAGVAALAALATFTLPRPGKRVVPALAMPRRPVWLLAVGFSCFTTFNVGILALLPTYLIEQRGESTQTAVLVTAAASLATVFGGTAASLMLRRAGGIARIHALTVFAGLLVPALLALGAFPAAAIDPWLGDREVHAAAILLNALAGIYAAVAFASLPGLAGPDSQHTGGVAVANGVLAQFGAGGSLLGPPLFAFLAGLAGWWVIGPASLALACLSSALFVAALHRRTGNPVASL